MKIILAVVVNIVIQLKVGIMSMTRKRCMMDIMANIFLKVDGHWGSWSSWSSCTKTCGEGNITRTRNCDSPAPAHGGESCAGDESQSKGCTNDPCRQRISDINFIFTILYYTYFYLLIFTKTVSFILLNLTLIFSINIPDFPDNVLST